MEKDAICLCKNKGRVNRDSLTVLSAEGNMIVQCVETTQNMFIPQINIEIFFSLSKVSSLSVSGNTKPLFFVFF